MSIDPVLCMATPAVPLIHKLKKKFLWTRLFRSEDSEKHNNFDIGDTLTQNSIIAAICQ